jgi:CHASE3 domain sensor protein
MGYLGRVARRLFPSVLNCSIGTRVLAGFWLTAALALAVAVVSLIYNRDAGRSLARVTERDRALAADFRELLIAVEQQTAAVQSFLLSGLDSDLDALQTARVRFHAALSRLEEGLPPAERADNFEQIREGARALDDLAVQDIALYRQGWRASAHFLWRTEGEQAKQQLLQAIQQQVERHNAAVDAEIGRSQDHLRFAFAASLGLVALAAVTAFLIGAGITRAVTEPVRALVQAATAVRGGDYAVRAPVFGEDELATLSATFNEMVESLAASRAELECALAETERSEERYRLLTEKANDIIFTIDRQNRITFINPLLVIPSSTSTRRSFHAQSSPHPREGAAGHRPPEREGDRRLAHVRAGDGADPGSGPRSDPRPERHMDLGFHPHRPGGSRGHRRPVRPGERGRPGGLGSGHRLR